MLTLISGTCRVKTPDISVSELLTSLNPDEEVHLPDWIECRLQYVPAILKFVSTHSETLNSASPETKAVMCTRCMPSMSEGNLITEALLLLDIMNFLDIRAGVDMLLSYLKITLSVCPTVDAMVACLYTPVEFESFPITDQRKIYTVLLDLV